MKNISHENKDRVCSMGVSFIVKPSLLALCLVASSLALVLANADV